MKNFYLILTFLFLMICSAKTQEVQPDWVTFDLTNYTPLFWLDNNRNEAIALIGHSSSIKDVSDFELHFYDLKTHELLKRVDTKTNSINANMKLNTKYSEFYYKFQDTIFFINKDDYNLKEKYILPFNYLLSNDFWYDYHSNQYILFSKREGEAIFVRFSPTDHTIIKYDTLKIETSFNYRLNYSENGQYFTLLTGDKEVMVYDTETLKFLRKVNTANIINNLNVSDNGQWLGVFTNHESPETILMFNVNDSILDYSIENKLYAIPHIRYSEDGKLFLLSYQSGCFVYDIETKNLIRFIDEPNAYLNAKFCLDDTKVIDITNGRDLVLSDINTPQFDYLATYDRFGKIFLVNNIKFSKNGEKFYVSCREGKVVVRNTENGTNLDEFNFEQASIYILNNNIDDTLIVCSGSKNIIYYIDVKTKNILKSIELNTESITSGIISQNYEWIATTVYKKGIKIFNLKSSENEVFYLDSTEDITSINFSSDSKLIALGMQDSLIKIYKTEEFGMENIPISVINYPSSKLPTRINFIKFVDNNSKLITNSARINKFMVWDVLTGDSLLNPTAPKEHFFGNDYPPILYMEYRNNFNDYVTVDIIGNIIFWDKNFKFKNCIKIGKSLGQDGATAFDYDSQGNNLLVAAQYSTIAKINLDFVSDVYEDFTGKPSMNIYPNPTGDFITIQFSNKELQLFAEGEIVQIFDVLGIEVLSVETRHAMSLQHIDVSHLPAGVYFIRFGNKVEKFVKM